ncbi:MAG: hypothetical protein ACLFSQ_07710 [Candidatus Zixiibacteriota bacterium]
MKTRKEALALFIKELNFTPETVEKSFDARFHIQKYIYLLQEWKGYQWSYPYNMYVSGPYSPDLTKDVYSVIENGNFEQFSKGQLNSEFIEDLRNVKNLTQDDETLEALSTLFYIFKSYLWANKDVEELKEHIFQSFRTAKPRISNDIRDRAWEILKSQIFQDFTD